MKILQVNAVYGLGSTGTIVKEIQSCCTRHGIACYAAYSIAGRQEGEVHGGYRIGNKLTAKWHALMGRLFGRQAYFNRISTWLFLRWIKKVEPDVVHLHNLHSNYIHLNMLLRFLAKHDIPTVVTMHDCWYFTGGCTHYASVNCLRWQDGCGSCPKRKSLPSWVFDRSSCVLQDRRRYLSAIPRLTLVGASEWIAEEARKSVLKEERIRFIHNGFDLSVFKPSASKIRERLGLINRYVILGPANKWLLPVNRATLEYFISHMPEDVVLVLLGQNNTPAVSLSQQIISYGYVRDRREMAELYSMADVMVNCSREDTLSSLNLECQACGTPVVTYDATGSKETVDGKCGFAVKTGDEKSLWERVMAIRALGKDAISADCVSWVSEHFNKEKNYERYMDLYNEITSAK